MATATPREAGQSDQGVAVEQSMLHQAQAAAAAQSDSTPLAREGALYDYTDIITSDLAEDELPPPAYGDVYGEIRNEKDGLNTSATVSDDGRVNIRINQVNRRLSQVFIPALRQEAQSTQDSGPPPPCYIPPSLGGQEGSPSLPKLNVVIQVVGSRGDVQPFVALGKVLKNFYGHRVRLATHPTFRKFVEDNGLEFFSIGGDPSQLMAFMVKNPSLMPGFRSIISGDVGKRRKDVAEYIQGCWRSCYKTGDGMSDEADSSSSTDEGPEVAAKPFVADCIIANPPSFAHVHCAEKLGIPLHIMFTMPYSPTQAFPHPLANIQSSNADPQLTNYISYAMIEVLSWQGIGDIINRFRKKCLGLEPISIMWAPGMLHRLKVPHTYCWSPALIPKPRDWGSHISISGFYFLDLASEYTPDPDLKAFLDAGPTPVYIGFGSIVLEDPNKMTELIFETVRKTGQRVLLSKGWGGMGADELRSRTPEGVFMLGNVPHDWLFKQVSCVVHHGGAGTTAAGITAGRPTIIVPFFGDQPFWGAMVARAGAGPDPIPHKQLTAERLADAINFCLRPESLERARDLASRISSERGSDTGALSFHQYLEPDRLRCLLAPSRCAVWRIKRTKIRLSAFAACTLANANLLDFHDLKLFRAQEYITDEGPRDPVSGPFMTACRAFSNMGIGIFELPTETYKAFQGSSRSNQQNSQASTSKNGTEATSSGTGKGSSMSISRVQSETSSTQSKSIANVKSLTQSSTSLNTSKNFGSGLESSMLERQSSSSRGGTTEDRDMLSQTGPHRSQGAGRFTKALVQSPMELSVSITKGFHNMPKLWGDETVRPQERVSDFKSGMRAMGREFGFGIYDGITGLVMQPWKGAQREGAAGFLKGFGKGVGGFMTKSGAAMVGILGHPMKGVHKEIQKRYGRSVQNYIIVSRVTQGHEEWLQSSDAEKQDVIDRWALIQKYLKKKHTSEEMMKDILETQRKDRIFVGGANPQISSRSSFNVSMDRSESSVLGSDPERPRLHHANTAPAEFIADSGSRGSILGATRDTYLGDMDGDLNSRGRVREVTEVYQQAQEDEIQQALALSEADARRYADDTMNYERQLEKAMMESLNEQAWGRSRRRQASDDSDLERNRLENSEKGEQPSAELEGNEKVKAPFPSNQQTPIYDQGHLEGITRSGFQAQQQEQNPSGEKSIQERTEEDIVMKYVKKQSLLETQHYQNKGKARATNTAADNDEEEDDDDDVEEADFQRALKLSMRET